jgi:hypothetical protein
MAGTGGTIIAYCLGRSDLERWSGEAQKMNSSKTSQSANKERRHAERLEIARRLYQALVAQDPDRVVILCDGSGRVVARHDLRREQADPEIAS